MTGSRIRRVAFFLAAGLGALVALGGTSAAALPCRPQGEAEEPARPRVRTVRVEGNERTTSAQIAAAFGQVSGQPLLGERELRRGVQIVFDTFRARVQAELVAIPGVEGEIELLLRVEELPLDPEVRFVGNVAIDDDEVREWAGLGEREELFLYQAPRIRARLLQHYRDEGFAFAEVRVVDRPAGSDPSSGRSVPPDLIFEIQEGPEVKVRDIVLNGNSLLPDRGFLLFKRGLSKLAGVELRSPWLFGWFAKDFVRETLDADIEAMRTVYRDLGYLDAVVELERLEFSDDREWVTIHVAIEEGEPYRVEAIELQALRRVRDERAPGGFREEPAELLLDEGELRAALKLRVGEVFQQRHVDEDHRALRKLYGSRGHIEHPTLPAGEGFRFEEPELFFDEHEPKVRVVYRLVQGEPIRIREVRIRGNLHTQDAVLRRLITVEPGQLADPEAIERSRSRIEATDFFTPDPFRQDILPPQVHYLDTGDPAVKDLEFVVEESGVLNFNLSGGVSTSNGLFGSIQLRKGNFDVTNLPSSLGSTFGEIGRLEAFHGAGQNLSLFASPGTQVSRYGVSFFEPDIFALQKNYVGLGLNVVNSRRRFESHREHRRDYSVRLQRQLSPDSSASLSYGYGSVDVTDLATGGEPGLTTPLGVPTDLKAQEGLSQLGHLDLGYHYTTVDSGIAPRNGLSLNLRASLYDDWLGSEFDFARASAELDFYDEFDEDPDIVSDFVHLGVSLSLGAAYGGTDEIPYTERTFFGGRDLRGFDFRGVGPHENGFPIGGTSALLATLEYRRPLVKNIQPGSYREIESLQGGLFIDVGVLDPDEFSLDPNEVRASVGFLFGIQVPWPLTFSFGFPIREGDGDDKQVFEFEFGF